MPGRIVLLGATGYTGRLVADAMVARGLRPVLAGRDEGRLDDLSRSLGAGLDTARSDVADPPSVRALVERGDVLVSTVGPFVRHGGPAAAAAADAGAHYLDSTGEPPFIRRVFGRYGRAAELSGAGMITAFGYDFVPGNLAGAIALKRAGDRATRVDVGYFLTGDAGLA
ncbi:MAG: saccharopine dehydrogenase NADP-binding domain-containing protein, partial [Thermoleophilaceae bacterium]|nr:saccharopine dehydrogenase NADP-binding domain-containing protein [Thermoleophilaceae bacterium]